MTMPDLNHSLNYPENIWTKSPKDLQTKDLELGFETAWKSPRTSEQEIVRLHMLAAELNSRTSKRYFWASLILSVLALIISIISLFMK